MDIISLTKANEMTILNNENTSIGMERGTLIGICGSIQICLPINDLVNLDSLRDRLVKDLSKAEKEISRLSSRLENSDFIGKAPIEVVTDCRTKLSEAHSQFKWSKHHLDQLN